MYDKDWTCGCVEDNEACKDYYYGFVNKEKINKFLR